MREEYEEIVQKLAAKLLKAYTTELELTNDINEYFATVIGALVFKNLALMQFKKELASDISEEPNSSPEEICQELEEKAQELATQIKFSVSKNSLN